MALPGFNNQGDLLEGMHIATLAEVLERFGQGSEERRVATAALQRIYRLAVGTGRLERFVIFGSYITAKPEPNDVDVVLVMKDDFSMATCDSRRGCFSIISGLRARSGPASFGSARVPSFAGRWRTFSWDGEPNVT